MLKKLFSRKKTPGSTPVKTESPVATAPTSLEHWIEKITTAQGKAKTQAMNGLSETIQKGDFQIDDVLKSLPDSERLMFAIAFEQPLPDVSQRQWQALVLEGFNVTIRKSAASQVKDHDLLVDLVKQTKGKDKTVYRILHDELEAQNQAVKTEQEKTDKKMALLEGIEKLADAPLEPMYEAKLKGLIEQWRDFAQDDAGDNTRFESAQQKAQLKIDTAAAQELAQKAQAETVEMADDNRQALIDKLIAQMLARLTRMEYTEQTVSDDQHLLSDIQHQWREIEQHSKANKEEYRAFQKTCTAFEVGLPRLQHLLEKHGDLETILNALNDAENDNEALLHEIDDWLHEVEFVLAVQVPENVVKLQQALKQYQKSLAEHRQQEIDKVRSIRGQLRRCLQAVEEGSLRRASGLYHGVEEKLEGFDLTHHAGIRKQLEETTEALEKLRDWQSYAVLPKKEALIKKMSALVEQSLDPETRAQTIRDMQDEWKLLSRGLQNRQQDLWETFHELAQQAYEPCKEYFSEQRHLREVNLDRRKEVVEQLTQYGEMINWESPDIKEIDRVLQVARNDWRHYTPVDRVANKPIQTEFDRVHGELFEKLRKEQDVFKQNKLDIIEKAKGLLELEDAKEATEKAKQLQKDWKNAGIVARKDEQQLWKAFREVCDELFERRDQQVTAFKADLETNRAKAEELIGSIEELAGSSEVLAEQSVFENLKEQYDQLGTLPKAHYAKMSKRYRDACSAFEAACKAAKSRAADKHWLALIDWVKDVRFGDLVAEDVRQGFEALTVPDEAKRLTDAIGGWLSAVDDLNLAAMHEKTIDLEILTGHDSPAVDSEIRMNLQVQRLSEGIGASTTDRDVHQMVVEWLAIGAVEQADYERFEARMKAAREHWLK